MYLEETVADGNIQQQFIPSSETFAPLVSGIKQIVLCIDSKRQFSTYEKTNADAQFTLHPYII